MSDLLAAMTLANWVTAALSVLALTLSAYSLYLQRRDKRPRLELLNLTPDRERIQRSYDPLTDTAKYEEWPVVRLKMANRGDRPLTIDRVEVQPIFGRPRPATLTEHGRDFVELQLKPDEARNAEADAGQSPFATAGQIRRAIPLYRLCVHDHMGRVWRSRYFVWR